MKWLPIAEILIVSGFSSLVWQLVSIGLGRSIDGAYLLLAVASLIVGLVTQRWRR